MSTKVTIQDIANELHLSRNTVSKAINNTGALADATRRRSWRRRRNGIQGIFLPSAFDGTAMPGMLPFSPSISEIAILTTRFLNNPTLPHDVDRFQSELQHLHACMTIHRGRLSWLQGAAVFLNTEHTAGITRFSYLTDDYAQMLCTL